MSKYDDLAGPAQQCLQQADAALNRAAHIPGDLAQIRQQVTPELVGHADLAAAFGDLLDTLGATTQDMLHRARADNAAIAERARDERQQAQDRRGGNA